MERDFGDMLASRWETANSLVCVGLDSKFVEIPKTAHQSGNECKISIPNTMVAFNRAIVEATYDLVSTYKPNLGFYLAQGDEGLRALQRTIADIHAIARDVPVILDPKEGDIGNTNLGYAEMAFDYLKADAITVNPYLGGEALKPFFNRANKGIFVLCRTSNKGAGEFQDLRVSMGGNPNRVPLYQYVAHRVATNWNENGNCGLVVGATYPQELAAVRSIVGDEMFILSPGVGKQGADVEATVKAGIDSRKQGLLINSSSAIIFASSGSDYAEAARRETIKLRDTINQYRKNEKRQYVIYR